MISAWATVLLAVPVLCLGQMLVRRIHLLNRFNIPAPVAGGLIVSVVLLLWNLLGTPVQFETKVAARWWTWLVTIEPEWINAPVKSINLPFLVGFFTCIGLNASWALARKGSVYVAIFLGLASLLAVLQNTLGVLLAKAIGIPPLLGLVCGSTTMTGGHGTAMGFAGEFEKAGLHGAAAMGMAAATFGLIAGGLLGGPVGGSLIRRNQLKPSVPPATHLEAGDAAPSGILADIRALWILGQPALRHLLILLVCVKLGAWVSFGIQQTGITFPVYMGAMVVAVVVRNTCDYSGLRLLQTETIDTFASVLLGIFLAIAMMSLNLVELANAALPMLMILSCQVILMALFARYVTYRFMGRDFDAAVISGGHCGFGLGATPNAIANMKALTEAFGPSPKAFLVVPIVGAFLADFVNALNITFFLNLLKP